MSVLSELVAVKRWARLEDFSPLSPQQVKAYLISRRLPVPKHRTARGDDGERKDTTNDESLTELLREGKPGFGDKVLAGILEARHTNKALGYLSEKFVRKGRFHPIYTNRPKQRLASARPNTMNFPKGAKGDVMKEAAEYVLGSIIADEGFELFSCDWNSLHPSLIAFFAKDPQYARIARLGDHAYVMSHFLAGEGRLSAPVNIERPDDVVKAELSALKEQFPADYKVCKVGNLAYKYLQGVTNMAKTLGLSVEKTKRIRAAIDLASPKVKEWKWEVLHQAHFQGGLVSPFGLPIKFFDVFKRAPGGKVQVDREGVPILGSEAPEASAFLPISTESGMLREVLVDLGSHPEEGDTFHLLIPEHDKVIGQARIGQTARILREVIIPSMTRKWPELDGHSVGVDVEVGRALNSMEPWQ